MPFEENYFKKTRKSYYVFSQVFQSKLAIWSFTNIFFFFFFLSNQKTLLVGWIERRNYFLRNCLNILMTTVWGTLFFQSSSMYVF